MSYDVIASSGYQALPAELFEIVYGGGVDDVVRFTSFDQDITIGTDTYISIEASFDGVMDEGKANDADAMKLELPLNNAFADIVRSTDFSTAIIIKQLATDLNDVTEQIVGLNAGRMTNINWTDDQMIISLENNATTQRRTAGTWVNGPQCPHAVYGITCRLDKSNWETQGDVIAYDGNIALNIDEAAGFADGYFTGGMLSHNGVSRFILSHVGTAISITRSMFGLEGNLDGLGEINQLFYTQELDDSAWIKTGLTVTANAAADPNGKITAELLTGDGATSGPNVTQSISAPTTGEVTYTLSAYVQENDAPYIVLRIKNSAGGDSYAVKWLWTTGVLAYDSEVELVGVTGNSNSITDEGNGLYRVTLTATLTCTETDQIEAGVFVYHGEVGAGGSYVWGVQLERSAAVSAYQRNLDHLGGLANVSLYPGCDRSAQACNEKFSNLLNYGGDDYMPQKGPFEGNSLV